MSRDSDPRVRILRDAEWLLAPDLATCVVGSAALRAACARRGVAGPRVADLDLAWACDVERGEALLHRHGVQIATTDANRERGTLALRLGTERVEITCFRGSDDGTTLTRIEADLARRDMTVGGIAWWLAEDRIVDPHGGVDDWLARRITPIGEPAERVREHPIRWLRYYRKSHAWGFELDPSIRKLGLHPSVLDVVPPEAIAGELRAALETSPSPGQCLTELFEVGVLQQIAPELAAQFDGRPAGPVRYHPEIGQALHMVLALEWAATNSRELPRADRFAVLFAVLCHDLGKNLSPAAEFPSHKGHEQAGIAVIHALCRRLPSLADTATRKLAAQVAELHLIARGMSELRPGTLARLFDQHFRDQSFRRDLFALALAADFAGRLGRAHEGDAVAERVRADIDQLCARCESVDAANLRLAHPEVADFRRALHEARARAIAGRS